MSAQLAGLTRCVLSAVASLLLTVSSAVAEPIYTVTDQGVSSDTLLSSGGDSSMSVITQKRLTLDATGHVTIGTWGFPGDYSGPLPSSLDPGAYGISAVATTHAGANAAGWGFDKDRAWAGFADIGGHATAVGNLPGQVWSQALGVNELGQVVGLSGDAHHVQAFLYTQDQGIKPLGPVGAGSGAYAINNSGQIVGEVVNGTGSVGHAFTSFNDGPVVDLNRVIDPASGWTLTRAMDINAAGQIAAFGLDPEGQMHALLLTPTAPVDPTRLAAAASGADGDPAAPLSGDPGSPQTVPEPSALALVGLVTAGLVARRGLGRRRPR